jgi:HK97 family phage portal protein
VHRIIHDQPNRDMGAMMFRARGINHQVNAGGCFNEIRRTIGGEPLSLEPIHFRRIPPQNIRREDDGRIVYLVNRPDGGGQPQRVKQEDMFHVPSIISEDGIIGKGVVAAARESIGKAMGTQRRGAAAINNGGAPPLALKGAKFKDKADREEYRRQLNEVHSGPENAGKWLLLPEGSEVEMLGFSLEDSQFIESENFDVEEIARWYGVPPHLVGHLLRATFNNIEELGISFVKYSLIQWLKLWEQEVWRKLLTEKEQETHYAKFVVDALERGNLATRTEAGVKKFFNGLWTLNQWAEQEDMNPITETTMVDGKSVNLGDVNFVQQAMIPLAQAVKGQQQPQPAAPPPPPDDPDDGIEPLRNQITAVATSTAALAVSVERVVAVVGTLQAENSRLTDCIEKNHSCVLAAIESSKVEALATKAEITSRINAMESAGNAKSDRGSIVQKQLAEALVRDVLARLLSVEVHNVKNIAQQASKFDQRLGAFYDKHRLTMERALYGPVNAMLHLSADGPVDTPPRLAVWVGGYCGESIKQLNSLTECQPDELAGKVSECVDRWHEERAMVTL